MQNYKDLFVWKKARALVLCIYKLTSGFPKAEQFNLISQIRRTATSIPLNVAEGKYTQSDLANYLQTALSSSNEVEYLSFLSHELGYLKDDSFKNVELQINEVKAMLISLITKVRKQSFKL